MVMVNERVKNILSLVERFKAFELSHVDKLYYNYKYSHIACQKKLTAMCKDGLLKRKRNNLNARYFYYLDKEPKQLEHKLKLLDLYVDMCMKHGIDNVMCIPEYTIDGIRPDAYIEVIDGKRKYLFYVEVQICNIPVDLAKYEPLYKKADEVFPTIIVIGKKAEHEFLPVKCL